MTVDAVGGVWQYAVDAACGLAAFDVECLLVGFGPQPTTAQRAECERLANTSLAWLEEPLDWMASSRAALAGGSKSLSRLACSWEADLLHLNVPSQAASLPNDFPVVVASHSCLPTWWRTVRQGDLPAEWAWHHPCNQQGFQRATAVVVPSRSHAAALRNVYEAMPPMHIVHNATTASPSSEPKVPMILAAGRWWDTSKNGLALDLAAPDSPWPLTLAGALCGPNGETASFSNVRTPGSIPHNDVLALMRQTTIFAAPSHYEPFGIAVAEAAASGAALVLSDIPVFRELWPDAALFVAPDDVAGWAEAFRRLAGDPALRQQLTTQSYARARQFTVARQAAALHDIYLSVRAAIPA